MIPIILNESKDKLNDLLKDAHDEQIGDNLFVLMILARKFVRSRFLDSQFPQILQNDLRCNSNETNQS